jgi:ketosteroid isomerase-like protein
MLRYLLSTILLLCLGSQLSAQSNEDHIRSLLSAQSEAWNRGDIDQFMDGYIRSDDLHFLGENGLTAGWTATRNNYQKVYPDTATMGKLRFELHEITRRTDDVYTVIGRYFLKRRTLSDLDGYFLLVALRTEDGWKIAADSTH